MWQRFSEHARRVVFFAQEEAGRQHRSEVAPEHLLLGLLRERGSLGARLLDRLGVPMDDLHARLTQQLTQGDSAPGADMSLAAASKRVIDLASEEARQRDNHTIGTEHLLLGLLREADSAAAETLRAFGADAERVRAALEETSAAEPEAARKSGLNKLRDALSALVENEPRPAREETIADPVPTTPVPHTGDRGILRDPAHATPARPLIEVAADADALFALDAAFRTRDHTGYLDLSARAAFFLVPAGTRVKILLPPKRKGRPAASWRVRILDGEHEGQAGWVRAADFERTDPDDDLFPPILPLEA